MDKQVDRSQQLISPKLRRTWLLLIRSRSCACKYSCTHLRWRVLDGWCLSCPGNAALARCSCASILQPPICHIQAWNFLPRKAYLFSIRKAFRERNMRIKTLIQENTTHPYTGRARWLFYLIHPRVCSGNLEDQPGEWHTIKKSLFSTNQKWLVMNHTSS